MDDKVGLSICVFQKDQIIDVKRYKLQEKNSVFQAELMAIVEAIRWGEQNGQIVNIFSDSKSAISALSSFRCQTEIVAEAKRYIKNRIDKFSLQWIKAHDYNYGNEMADLEAKRATTDGAFMSVKLPRSHLKSLFENYQVDMWKNEWSSVQNRVKQYIPSIEKNISTLNKSIIQFLTGHGPFRDYLYRFKIKNTQFCPCGRVGDPDHYIFECDFTKEFHLNRPPFDDKFLWLKKLINDGKQIYHLKKCIEIANVKANENP